MNVKGRLKDGTYDLSLTFHKKTGTPTAADLVVKTEVYLRPALTVNGGGTVPVKSNNASKTTSEGINVHNGFNSRRWSEGCLTIEPSEWCASSSTCTRTSPTGTRGTGRSARSAPSTCGGESAWEWERGVRTKAAGCQRATRGGVAGGRGAPRRPEWGEAPGGPFQPGG